MNILLTFDVEIWCNSWHTLEQDFPSSFDRYIYGRSVAGEFALPKTLEILDRHGLKGVFFVEPLFATHFGVEHLATIVELIQGAGQEVQLHLHPEWTDEARSPLLPNVAAKRQHLSHYTRDEQQTLVAHGLRLLREAGADTPNTFRSGSFACNADTFAAVSANELKFDSSINSTLPISQPCEVRDPQAGDGEPFVFDGLGLFPMSIFRDGFGRPRHAQIGACSARELIEAMTCAQRTGWPSFVLLSHNFELLMPGKPDPDHIVVKRFEQICRFLAENRHSLPTCRFSNLPLPAPPRRLAVPQAGRLATSTRYVEQALRRLQ